jgi:riboflavin synthase
MFTGIVTDVGEIVDVEARGDTAFTIACAYDPRSIAIGASIACAGVCLTVLEVSPLAAGRSVFTVEASAETLSRTTLGDWAKGSPVNLERALRLGEELGGHMVSGHVDGVATIAAVRAEGDSRRFSFEAPEHLARFIAAKGSVALDGTSLTVNEVDGARFGVNLISHTLAVTTWGRACPGDRANIEIDMLARYVARLQEFA